MRRASPHLSKITTADCSETGGMIGSALELSLLIKVFSNLSMWNPQAQCRCCKNVVFMENLLEFVVERRLKYNMGTNVV